MKKYHEKEVDAKKISFTKYTIIVPSYKDRKELIEASKHIHDASLGCDCRYGIDTDNIIINQLAHEYLKGANIKVDKKLYEKLNAKK